MFIHGREAGWCRVQALRLPFPLKRLIFQDIGYIGMVGATGIEPVTPAVSRQCSTAELRTQYLINYSKLKINL